MHGDAKGGTAPETTVEDEMKMAFEWALDIRNHWVWKSGERAFQKPSGWRNRANLDLQSTHEEWDDAMVSLGICYRTELGNLLFFLKGGINNPLIEQEDGTHFACEDCEPIVNNRNNRFGAEHRLCGPGAWLWYCHSCYRLNEKASIGYHAARREYGRKPATWLYRPANV